MFETHRTNPNASEVYRAQIPIDIDTALDTERMDTADPEGWEDDGIGEEEGERHGEITGETCLIKPKPDPRARNAPAAAASAQRGDNPISPLPQRAARERRWRKMEKVETHCFRGGNPDRFWGDCPHPFNPDRFGEKGKGNG